MLDVFFFFQIRLIYTDSALGILIACTCLWSTCQYIIRIYNLGSDIMLTVLWCLLLCMIWIWTQWPISIIWPWALYNLTLTFVTCVNDLTLTCDLSVLTMIYPWPLGFDLDLWPSMSILNLLLRPVSSFFLYKIYQERGGQYGNFGVPGMPNFGIG